MSHPTKIYTCLIWCTGLLLAGSPSNPVHGQQIDPPGALATNVVGIGANWIGQPAPSVQYCVDLVPEGLVWAVSWA
jgi:hypothetical protein